jgi:hypothetical protein
MKQAVFILSVAVVILGISLFFTNESKNQYKADLTHLKNTVDIKVRKKVNDVKRHVTDSLIKEFNSKPADTVIITKTKIKYEKITDSILVYPTSEQLEYISNELDRLYPNE